MKRFMIVLCVAAVVGLASATAHASVVVVTPSSMDGWAFLRTDPSVTYGAGDAVAEMVNGPATPPLGSGSAHFNTGSDGFQSAQLRNSSWAGTRIDALTSLGYSTYATAWNGSQLPYLTIYLDTDGNGIRDDRLWFEPTYSRAGAGNGNPSPQADPVLGTWQTWNLLTGMWYSDIVPGPGSNAKTLADYLALKPNATIINDIDGGGRGGIRIASGFASSGDSFNAYVDAFTIGTAAGTTTYDFEAQAPVPEPGTIIVWSLLGLVAAGYGVWWQKQAA